MRPAVFVILAAGLASAQNGPRVLYSKSFPGSAPPYVGITVEPGGAATYRESKDDDPETFALESDVAATIFDMAAKLDHFKRPLESGLKVANMGAKTFRWEDGAENHETKFNYSLDENARALQDWFEKITDSERAYLALDRAVKHDRLGVHQAMLQLVSLWEQKRLVATAQMLPLLDRVANNEAFINMARERATWLAGTIRARAKPE
jgi:uncharacterized protein YecE (DUF72 family)